MKNIKTILAVILAVMLLFACAQAQQLNIDGSGLMLPVYEELGGEAVITEITGLDIYGTCGDGFILAGMGGSIVYIDRVDFEKEITGAVDFESMPNFGTGQPVQTGSPADDAKRVQQLLVDNGYLAGSVDGIFGAGSTAAVTAFQTEAGIEATGIADILTQIKLMEKAGIETGEPVTVKYPVEYDVADVFGAFASEVDCDLQPFANKNWELVYDEFDGKGELTPHITLGSYEYDAVPIDRIALNSELTVVIENGNNVYPALKVTARGAYGVYMQSVSVKGGNKVVKLETPVTERITEGADIIETALFPVTDEAVEMLEGVTDGILALRVNGVNNTYDLVPGEPNAFISGYAKAVAASGMNEEE